MKQQAVLRLLDANGNRAMEGLRVCEDIVRLYLGTARGYRRIRALRHGVAQALRALPATSTQLLRARNSRQDPGRKAPGSSIRSLEQLLVINFQRAKESLRVLEESARVLAPRRGGAFQRLRFLTYDIERDILLSVAALRHH